MLPPAALVGSVLRGSGAAGGLHSRSGSGFKSSSFCSGFNFARLRQTGRRHLFARGASASRQGQDEE